MATSAKSGAKPVKAPAAKTKSAAAPAKKVAAKPAKAPATKTPAVKAPAAKRSPAVAPRAASPDQHRYYVEVAAYYIAERRGFHGGSQLDDWVQAEAEINRLLRDGVIGS